MPPFDFNTPDDSLLAGTPLVVYEMVSMGLPVPNTDLFEMSEISAQRSTYALSDHDHRVIPANAQPASAGASSMQTTSYFEYLLQVLDKNATLSSVCFILAYAELLNVM